jgi:hypothetical protein
LLSVLLATFAAHGAEVYRSTDANGVVRYSDRPEGEDAKSIYVATPRPGRPGNTVVPKAAAKPAANQPGASDGQQAADGRERVEPTAAERAAERAKNCQTARERENKYAISHRLYRALPNGEREYLSDAEMDEAKAKAAEDVKTWCD